MAREVKTSGRTVYLPDRDEWEPVPTLWRCPSCGVETKSQERAEKLGHRRPPHKIGMCFTKMELVKPEEPEEPRAGPYALGFEVSGFVEHELRCSGCGRLATGPDTTPTSLGRYHYVPAPGGWRRCGEWR